MGPACCRISKTNSRNPSPESTPSPERSSLPPGPSGLPCVGSLLEWKGPQTNLAWTKRFGSIYRVKMGSKNLVYLNTVELIEQYMEGRKGERYLDRPSGPGAIAEGLLFGSGETWKKNKHAFMKALYTVTFDAHMEEAVQAEIKMTVDCLQKHVDKPIKLGDFLLPSCICVIPGLFLGCSLPLGSPDRDALIKVAQNMEGVDLTSLFTQISLKHPKLREPLSKLMFKDIVDIHGTSRRLQNLLRLWIRDSTGNPMSPTSPRFENTFGQKGHIQTETTSSTTVGDCPFRQNPKRLKIIQEESKADDRDQESHCPHHQHTQDADQQEPLLTPPRNDKLIESAMINASHLVAFGFTDMGHGEQAFEETEPPSPQITVPCTPITEHKWTFSRQMSLNTNKESILQRILKQPEFANVTEGTDAELLQSLIDFFFGGVTSTLAALEYIFVHLVRNPEFQRLARQEVDEVVSKNGDLITWSLEQDMPYVKACITEALRLGAVTPSSLPHVATEDTEIEGYSIKEGTFVMASIISIHHDPSHYIDPEVFRPQRHLTGDRKFKQPTSFKPYGVGARRCVGNKMAGMQLFIYTVYILRHFEIQPISTKSLPSLDTHMRIINRLKDFRCILKRRDV